MPATTKKPIKIVPNTIKTIPKVPLSPISKSKSFQEKLNDIQNNIDINIDDIPEDLLDIWDELQEDITPKLISKNYKLWLTIFTPFILPGIINGMSGKPAVPQPVVTVQEPAPDPKQIVNFAQKYFAEHGLELCKSLTKTDLNSMKQDLINNWGKGPDAFSKAFQDSYPVSKARLENIYRSERHIAEYHGVLERAKIADHKYKQWRAVGDERSCDLCMSHDMETVPINEPFSNGEMTATGHPQCRCSMVTYSDEDYNEMKENSSYLADAFETIKLNYNCPDDEKIGSGPGSCSGGNTSNLDKVSTLKNKIRELEKSVSEGKSTFDEAYEQYKSIQKELDLELEKEKLRNPDNAKITNDIVTDPEPITPYKALSDYQNYAYTAINDYLRKTNHVKQNPQQTKNIQNMIKTIDSEMENNPLKSDKLVFRADSAGISSDAFEKTGLTNIFKDTFGKESLTLEDFIKNPKLIDKIREKLVGYEYTEKAYLSTGSDKENTMNRFLAPSRDISKYGVTGLINLIVPKGTPAIRIADYTGLEDELGGKIDEYLIGRDQTIVIDQVYIRPADDDRLYLEYNAHIKTNEQKQNSEYLEDVTNFIKLNYKCKAGTVDDSNKCELENSDVPETRTFHEENIKSKILSLNDSKYPKDAVFRSKSRSSMTKNVELDILNNDNHVKILSDNIDRLHYQCDNLKIPRLRGIVADKNTKAGLASMADGILAVTPDMFRNDPDSEVDLRLSRNQERLNYINNKINSLESLIQSDKEKWTKNNPSLVNSGMKFEESTFYKTGYPWPKEINEYKSEKNNIMARINDLNTKKTNALIYTWKPGMPDSEKPFGASEYFPFEQSPKLLLDHEFGHHIHQLYGVKNAKSYAEPPLEKKIDQIYKKSEKDGTLIVPSKYAASDHQEWFAESYSLYVNGRDDLVTPGLIDLFKKIGVKHDN